MINWQFKNEDILKLPICYSNIDSKFSGDELVPKHKKILIFHFFFVSLHKYV